MRKTQKNQVDQFINLLERAHGAVKRAFETGNYDITLNLLEQCQDIAIRMGGLIETTEGEEVRTISLLEDYCELVYQIHEEIPGKQIKNADKLYKSLRKSLIQIKNSVKNDIKVRTEIVFLPYKASMWDSLESIWKAAEEDPDCDAYVIPIPYYDKNPDGSFREIHYEGDLYPEYVPVVDYNRYDFEKRRPDMIYIHNPYDDSNHVTSVHPFFYSINLKNFTERLVYVPYFILNEIDPQNKEVVESMQHFCTVPGVFYADKVVVQSEDMRRIYINVLTKEMGKNTKKTWEEKILGLGSPKIDKVLSTKRENIKIPEAWLKIIRKKNGSWKKVILYNTSVSALLKYEEKMLRKIRYVLDVFKQNQEEAVLLWRPHPLIKATIDSMRPELRQEYHKIVEQYRKEAWGIYDDSPDMNRAVCLSDAYYGDLSSIVRLYRETGKPVMMQNIEVLK